eukprot:Awhi_evm1s14305
MSLDKKVDLEEGDCMQMETLQQLEEKNSENFLEEAAVNIGSSPGYALSWENVCYSVKVKKKVKKDIIKDASGIVLPQELTAMMGPSGAGKSSLLDLLSARNKVSSGTIKINGTPYRSSHKHIISYVQQEDTLMGDLTVEENIEYSARLRLPTSKGREEIKRLVNQVISDFGLDRVKKTKVGTVFIRGVSGGERRRVSIAVELVTQPLILFLDEPTSGLDSTSSHKVIQCLKDTAQKYNRTIIATIHQPASSTYELFDKLLLLSHGNTVYYGKTAEAIPYFASQGLVCPQFSNPADFFLDHLNVDFWENQDEGKKQIENLTDAYLDSDMYTANITAIENYNDSHETAGKTKEKFSYANNWFMQTVVLTERAFVNAMRNILVFWVRAAMYLAMAILMGTTWLSLGTDQNEIQDRYSVHFFTVAFLCFMAVAAIPAIIEDRSNFLKERSNGAYGVLPYVLANTFVALPFILLIALLFSSIAYPMIGLQSGAEHFFKFLAYLFLALFTMESLLQIIALLLPVFVAALAIGAFINGFFMVVQGYFVAFDNLPKFWIWAHYWSYQKYAFELLVYNDFTGLTFNCDVISTSVNGTQTCFCSVPSTTADPCTFSGTD